MSIAMCNKVLFPLYRAVKNSLKLKLLDLRTCRFITLQAIVVSYSLVCQI